MTLRYFRISSRTLTGFGILAVIVFGLGLVGLQALSNIRGQGPGVENKDVSGIVAADNLAIQLSRTRVEALRLLAVPDPESVAATRKKIDELTHSVQQSLEHYRQMADDEDELGELAALARMHDEYLAGMRQAADLLAFGKIDVARSLVQGRMAQLGGQMNQSTERLRGINQERIRKSAAGSGVAYGEARMMTWGAILIALCLTLLLAWQLIRSLAKPINQAVQAARSIAQGDLGETLEGEGRDEAAQLLQSMQQMQSRLRDTLVLVSKSSAQLSSAAEQMTNVMHDSAQGRRRQNGEIDRAATAVTGNVSCSSEQASQQLAALTAVLNERLKGLHT
ncbi:methyl-accepting chemotaxis protein [uncultured Pseudomonas sp.]|uniref:MCP four helix bundle domain-containing protein n=1 Tax=uncultured Pseudomonas sp. TaxID=114707 RepID=UPI0025DBD3BE|nr:methyl-accepting chemotaxis protein [uncultured Pseudomonas sp.]